MVAAATAIPARRSGYARREPERSVLYGTVAEHLETFCDRASAGAGAALPRFVQRELRAYLRCGILAHGFARVRCTGCGDDRVVAFSCKGRGFCPSCGGRRMADGAARLVDQVIPHVAVRQWVLTLPFALRYRVAFDASLRGQIRRIFQHTLFAWLRRKARAAGALDPRPGAVCVEQRSGSALNLNPHFHNLALDGVYDAGQDGRPVFRDTPAPTEQELEKIVHRIRRDVIALLRRRGLTALADRLEDPEASGDDDDDPLAGSEPLLAACAQASVAGVVAAGEQRGLAVARVRTPELARYDDDGSRPQLCADSGGFNLHAAVRVPAGARGRLEQLCRYVLRPPIATARLSKLPDGRLLYDLRRPWRDGTTSLLFRPLDFLARLAALVPAPRKNLVTYHGVLAPNAAWRAQVVPAVPVETRSKPLPPANDNKPAATRALDEGVVANNGAITARHRIPWAELLKRTFEVDVLHCDECGARREVIAFVNRRDVAEPILRALGLPSAAPPIAAAREPPQACLELP